MSLRHLQNFKTARNSPRKRRLRRGLIYLFMRVANFGLNTRPLS